MATFTRSGLFTPFTPIFNATGQPAISLPLYQGEDGLPLGVQLVGRPAGEGALLALADAARGGAAVGATAGPTASTSADAEHRGHRLGRDAEALGVGGAARAWSSRPPSARPRPRWRTRAGPVSTLERAQRARDDGERHVHERAAAAERAQRERARSRRG